MTEILCEGERERERERERKREREWERDEVRDRDRERQRGGCVLACVYMSGRCVHRLGRFCVCVCVCVCMCVFALCVCGGVHISHVYPWYVCVCVCVCSRTCPSHTCSPCVEVPTRTDTP